MREWQGATQSALCVLGPPAEAEETNRLASERNEEANAAASTCGTFVSAGDFFHSVHHT